MASSERKRAGLKPPARPPTRRAVGSRCFRSRQSANRNSPHVRHRSPDGVTLITLEAIPWKARRNLRDSFEETKMPENPEVGPRQRACSTSTGSRGRQRLDDRVIDINPTLDGRAGEQASTHTSLTSPVARGLSTVTHSNPITCAATHAGVLRRTASLLVLIAVALGLCTTAANAVPTKKVDSTLGALWTTVLETPDSQNPFGAGGKAFTCIDLGKQVLAPFGPDGAESCTVKTGTKIFVAASTVECSTFEGNGNTDAALRDCARQGDVQVAPSVTVDGTPKLVTEAETGLLHITLPAGNLFGLPAGTTGLSVGHGWITLLQPLTPGTHTIVIDTGAKTIKTRIVVQPGH